MVTKEQIEEILNKAIDQLLVADYDLLDIDANERSISHRLAVYLEGHFPGWNVDCEYNRDDTQTKRVNLNSPSKDIKFDDTKAVTVFPDIIVHKRKTEKNLLVIEMKKSSNDTRTGFDEAKLCAYVREYEYNFAVFLKFYVGEESGRLPDIKFIHPKN